MAGSSYKPKYRAPTKYELKQLFDLILRFTDMDYSKLATRLGISKVWVCNFMRKDNVMRRSTIQFLREGLIRVVKEEFDPFRPPVIGLDLEWYDMARSMRKLLLRAIYQTLPRAPKHIREKMR